MPGFRTESLVVVTSLLDAKDYSRDDLATLYRRRWVVELHIRDIKSAMKLEVLRCKTPAMVRQELWTGLLVYNLIRQSMLQSAHEAECEPDELSFTATMQMLANSWLLAAVMGDGTLRNLRAAGHATCRPRRFAPRGQPAGSSGTAGGETPSQIAPSADHPSQTSQGRASRQHLDVTSITASGSAIRDRNRLQVYLGIESIPDTFSQSSQAQD